MAFVHQLADTYELQRRGIDCAGARFDVAEPRDPHGRWSLVGAIKAALDASEVSDGRRAVREAKTTREVNAAAASAAHQITGHDVHFGLNEPTPIAREHADAILAQLEQHPHVRLRSVEMDNSDAQFDTLSSTEHDGSVIYFSPNAVAGGEFAHRDSLTGGAALHMTLTANPGDVAVHEFGHVVASSYPDVTERAIQRIDLFSRGAGNSAAFNAQSLSFYAATGSGEFIAEAFLDVSKNGDKAQPISRFIVNGMTADIASIEAGTTLPTISLPMVPTVTGGREYPRAPLVGTRPPTQGSSPKYLKQFPHGAPAKGRSNFTEDQLLDDGALRLRGVVE